MPGYTRNSQRRGTARTSQISFNYFYCYGIPIFYCYVCLEKDGEDQFDSHVRNEEVLLRVNEQRNFLHEIRKRKANWIGHG
jgi:hypothetical protein